jgi:diaminohydroxyphosphoribosylaminopyrimidine deaminase/5-amino-6-(5-phosphoribosylamino)uracil reductase
LGYLADQRWIDEVHVFVAPKLLGGRKAVPAFGGEGFAKVAESLRLVEVAWEMIEGDLYCRGRVDRSTAG